MSWIERDKALYRDLKTPDFMTAFAMLAVITPLAEKANHHPDIEMGWGYLRIKLTTHDAGGVTEKDHKLAKEIDRIVERFA